jgi:hypothetical protein
MFESLHVLHPAEICDMARHPATQPPTDSERCQIDHRCYGGVRLEGDESGCDECPMFAHATEALMSRLSTVNG